MWILLSILFSFGVFATDWNCKTINETMHIAKTSGCDNTRLCIGYAKCIIKDNKTITTQIACVAYPNLTCPDANECLNQSFKNHDINIVVQNKKNPRGVFKFCPSEQIAKSKNLKKGDEIYSEFCDVVNGVNPDAIDFPGPHAQTGTMGRTARNGQ